MADTARRERSRADEIAQSDLRESYGRVPSTPVKSLGHRQPQPRKQSEKPAAPTGDRGRREG